MTAFGLVGLFELAIDNIANYPRDCESMKAVLRRQQVQLTAIADAIEDSNDDCGKADLINSIADLKLAQAQLNKAVADYQRDCGKARRDYQGG